MRVTAYITMLLIASACQPVVDRSVHIAQEAKGSFWAAVDSLEEALQYQPAAKPQPEKERYCYRARFDIVCYDEPRYEPTIGALEGAQVPQAPMPEIERHQSAASAPISVSEPKPVASVDTAAFDPDAPEPLVGF